MRLPAFLVLAVAPLLVLAAACVDGATPDCSTPSAGCIVVPADASPDASDASASDAPASDAADAADAPKADASDAGDAGDAKTD